MTSRRRHADEDATEPTTPPTRVIPREKINDQRKQAATLRDSKEYRNHCPYHGDDTRPPSVTIVAAIGMQHKSKVP